MSHSTTLRMQYNADSVVIFEVDRHRKYEVARFTESELHETNGLPETIAQFRTLVEDNPNALLAKLYGSVERWERIKPEKEMSSA